MVIFIFQFGNILDPKIQKSHFKTKFGTYSWVSNRGPRTFFFHPPPPCLLIIGESFQSEFEMIYLRWLFCDLTKVVTRLYCVLFCKFVQRSQHGVFFCKLVKRNQLLANYWPHFAEVIECLLMFLLNVLLDLTDELDVFCQSFAIQITSASLYSILAYQIKFPPPNPGY